MDDTIGLFFCLLVGLAIILSSRSCVLDQAEMRKEVQLKAIEALKSNVELKLNFKDLKEIID